MRHGGIEEGRDRGSLRELVTSVGSRGSVALANPPTLDRGRDVVGSLWVR